MSAIQARTRKVYFAPTAGRTFLTLQGACNAEANARVRRKYPDEMTQYGDYGRVELPGWSFHEDARLVGARDRLARLLKRCAKRDGMRLETGLDEVTADLLVCLRDACAHLSLEVDCLKGGIELFEADGMTSTLSDAPEDAHTVARINEIEGVLGAAVVAIRKAERSQRPTHQKE